MIINLLDSVGYCSVAMEVQPIPTRRKIINERRPEVDQNQRPVCSTSRDLTSRDLSPVIRHDFLTSPWKRFRPSTDAVSHVQPSHPRSFPSCSRNFHEPSSSAERSQSRPREDMAPCTVQSRRRLSSIMQSSMDLPSFPATNVKASYQQPPNVRSRCPGFTVKEDSRLHLASSTGKNVMIIFCSSRYTSPTFADAFGNSFASQLKKYPTSATLSDPGQSFTL